MDTPLAGEDSKPAVVFRPSKKRKQFRQRADDKETEPDNATRQAGTPPAADNSDAKPQADDGANSETEGLSVAEALRLRNARKSRLKGVEFRPEGSSSTRAQADEEQDLDPKDDVNEMLELGMSRRFAPQAGLVGELVNKHMEEYIESELARRHAADKEAREALAAQQDLSNPMSSIKKLPDRPTMRGRLQEVDLGDEARMRTAEMTEQARRRLAGEAVEDDSDGSKRVRLGKDGKPLRSRKRRASEDIKRDQIVEEFMRENRLDVYDVPAQNQSDEAGDEEPADERIAAQFRREFMDAMADRRRRRRHRAPAPPPKPGAKKKEEILRGPKLGGSRNARAAMRDILLSQQEKKKKR